MILTVTLNAALDVTYDVDRVIWRGTNRVARVSERAGGKGVNVARVLAALGQLTVVTGLAGGPTGVAIRTDLVAAGLRDELEPVVGSSRRTVTVVDHEAGEATLFNEPGGVIAGAEWTRFRRRFARLATGACAVVLSGSLPPGVGDDAYAALIGEAAALGVPVVLDADGVALRHGLDAGPTLVKPNVDELTAITGRLPRGVDETRAAAAALRARGPAAVVVSLGPDGLLASTGDGEWSARPPRNLDGNPTGAGDAAVAALTRGLVHARSWPERLVDAVALSASAVCAPLAGDVDLEVYDRLLGEVVVEELRA